MNQTSEALFRLEPLGIPACQLHSRQAGGGWSAGSRSDGFLEHLPSGLVLGQASS